MDHAQEIDKAVGAHGMWKNRLKQAIESGKLDTPVATIRTNNQCAFGKWLYGPTLSAQDKSSEYYKTVTELHTQFHQVAAQVAELATSGKKNEAEKALAPDSRFASISSKLTAAMLSWKKSLSTVPHR
ncbi:MAG: CZB domain-containing protein [candidate division Zixibacteria bacterium]|nr:CZB domain-containing protein [candidate division Zixibacteria bacterium]